MLKNPFEITARFRSKISALENSKAELQRDNEKLVRNIETYRWEASHVRRREMGLSEELKNLRTRYELLDSLLKQLTINVTLPGSTK